ncbi:hypothetical protein C4577_06850 [Candidatus Parcubacteria bacterium]|nr:MAG: hypothetical protein C4577_06850 [Candidatus Parcubacteria bacterium]
MKKYEFSIIRPGGNDTLLIKGIVKKSLRKPLNNLAISLLPNIEQVGFYEYDQKSDTARLEMAGGEFCGNALRSLAYIILNGKVGEKKLKASGTNILLKAGIKKDKTAYAQMPIFKNLNCVKKVSNNLWLINLKGISFLIKRVYKKLPKKCAKSYGKELLQKFDLLNTKPASGVIFVTTNNLNIEIQPIVWVKQIETLFYETACASGTAATGLWKSIQKNDLEQTFKVLQPSGQIISVYVKRNRKKLTDVIIDGPIKVIKQKN